MFHLVATRPAKGTLIGANVRLAIDGERRVTLLAFASHLKCHEMFLWTPVSVVGSGLAPFRLVLRSHAKGLLSLRVDGTSLWPPLRALTAGQAGLQQSPHTDTGAPELAVTAFPRTARARLASVGSRSCRRRSRTVWHRATGVRSGTRWYSPCPRALGSPRVPSRWPSPMHKE